MEEKISIIVPVYNSSKYLKECIESIINQGYENIELLLIDDGSKDDSSAICKKYAKEDKRIKYYYQKNNGVSSARNLGIEKSTGTFIMFVDSDDYLENNCLKTLKKYLGIYDILCYGYNKVYTNKKITMVFDKKINELNDTISNIIDGEYIAGYIWNKVFLSDIIKKHNIIFDENISFCEDLLFCCEYMKYVKKPLYIKNHFYNYRMRQSSVSYSFFNKKSVSMLNAYGFLYDENKNKPEHANLLKYKYVSFYYRLLKYLDKKNIRKDILNDEKNILKKYQLSKNEKIKFYFIKYFNSLYICIKKLKTQKEKLYE